MRPEGLVAFAAMSAYVLLIIVFSVLWLFWAWMGSLFDAISDYHRKAAAVEAARTRKPRKGKGSLGLQSPSSSQHSSQHPQHPRTTSRF